MCAWTGKPDLRPQWQLTDIRVVCMPHYIHINLHMTGVVWPRRGRRDGKRQGNMAAIERSADMRDLHIRSTKGVWKVKREVVVTVGLVCRYARWKFPRALRNRRRIGEY